MREERNKEYDLMTRPKDTRLNAKANFKSAMKNDSVHACVYGCIYISNVCGVSRFIRSLCVCVVTVLLVHMLLYICMIIPLIKVKFMKWLGSQGGVIFALTVIKKGWSYNCR